MDPFRLASSLLDATGGVPVKQQTTTEDSDMTRKSNRRWQFLSGLLVVLALAVAGCGGGGSSSPKTSSTPAASAPASSSAQSSASGIPQGPNAGDQDSDNQGGPSDGDGNI
jgi:hypothetical protein